MRGYRKTKAEVTPGWKRPDSYVTKTLTPTQMEALTALRDGIAKGTMFTNWNAKEGEKRVLGMSMHSIRVSTERYQRYPSSDRLVSVTKNTMKPLEAAGLVESYNGSYSPDYTLTRAGYKAITDGTYSKVVDGEWVPAVMRDMTPEEQRESDIVFWQEQADHSAKKGVEAAEDTAKRLEDAAAQIRRAAEEYTPEKAKRWGADDLYFANGIVSCVTNVVRNMRFDILTSSEAQVLIALNQLSALKGE